MAIANTGEHEDTLENIVDRLTESGEPVILTRNGREVAALVPIEDLRAFEAWKDARDAAIADVALAKWEAEGRPTVPLEEVRRGFLARRHLEAAGDGDEAA